MLSFGSLVWLKPSAIMALAFPSMSASCLLHPLPEASLASLLSILRDVPSSLAEPFIRQELNRHGICADTRDIGNVLFKLRAAGLSQDVVNDVGPHLKILQQKCPASPTIYIPSDRDICATCPGVLLVEGKRLESFAQRMPQGTRELLQGVH